MADFKLTYATMFNPPEELHTGFDKAVEALKKNMGKKQVLAIVLTLQLADFQKNMQIKLFKNGLIILYYTKKYYVKTFKGESNDCGKSNNYHKGSGISGWI